MSTRSVSLGKFPHFYNSPGVFPADIEHWHHVYVYGDLIEHQFVRNSRARVLNTLPLLNPEYMPPAAVGEKMGGVLSYRDCSFITFSITMT